MTRTVITTENAPALAAPLSQGPHVASVEGSSESPV